MSAYFCISIVRSLKVKYFLQSEILTFNTVFTAAIVCGWEEDDFCFKISCSSFSRRHVKISEILDTCQTKERAKKTITIVLIPQDKSLKLNCWCLKSGFRKLPVQMDLKPEFHSKGLANCSEYHHQSSPAKCYLWWTPHSQRKRSCSKET